MMDALLFGVVDFLTSPQANMGYDAYTCAIMPDGHPAPGCGAIFLAVHQAESRSENDNCLNEYFNFNLTLTARVEGVPLDRVGDKLLASKLARRPGPNGQPSFNARCEQLRANLHMAWGVLQSANDFLIQVLPDASVVYGFCEPARYRTMSTPRFEYGEWFSADPEFAACGLVSELRFVDARRLQPIGMFV